MALDLNRDNYETEVLKSVDPVMVDFWGPQCRPCLALMPVVERLEKEYAGKIKVAKVNAAQNRMLCAKLRVMGLPAYLFYKAGIETNRLVGENITANDLVEAIKALIAWDNGMPQPRSPYEGVEMELKGKKAIIIGERDGVQGPAIEECIKSAGAEPLLVQTQCFVWTAAGALDPEGQENIKQIVDQYGKEDLIVILGAPDADSTEFYAETVMHGDPSWVGPLAGVALELPVYHIMEPEIKAQIDPEIYRQHLELMEIALDVDRISQALGKLRAESSGSH